MRGHRLFGFAFLMVTLLLTFVIVGCGGGGGSGGGGRKGTIAGSVRNNADTRLPGATVSVGKVRTNTDNKGDFRLEGVPVGTQTISASLTGYFDDGRGSASILVVEGQTGYLQDDLVLVATVGGEVYLRSLQASSSDFYEDAQQRLGGVVYFHCLASDRWWSGDTEEAIYSLGRRYGRFKSQIGVSDTESDLTAEVIFRVIGDGNILYQSQRLKVGRIATIDVDVTNILTLQLQVTKIGDVSPSVVWGDPRVTTK